MIFKNPTIKGFGIDAWINSKSNTEIKDTWNKIIQQLFDPGFRMDVAGKFPLEKYREAILENKRSKNGKVLFWMNH